MKQPSDNTPHWYARAIAGGALLGGVHGYMRPHSAFSGGMERGGKSLKGRLAGGVVGATLGASIGAMPQIMHDALSEHERYHTKSAAVPYVSAGLDKLLGPMFKLEGNEVKKNIPRYAASVAGAGIAGGAAGLGTLALARGIAKRLSPTAGERAIAFVKEHPLATGAAATGVGALALGGSSGHNKSAGIDRSRLVKFAMLAL